MLIKILIACILSGILYRMGGAKGYNTKFRDLGCPTIGLALILLTCNIQLTIVNLSLLLLTFGLSFGACTTYWDFIPFNKGEDNHFMHGFFCGLAGIPLIWVGIPLWIILARLTLCIVGMGFFSKLIGNDVKEELVRGALFIL